MTDTTKARLRVIYSRCDVSNNGTVNPMNFAEFQEWYDTEIAQAELRGRIGELTTCMSNVPMPTLSYEQVQNRVRYLQNRKREQP